MVKPNAARGVGKNKSESKLASDLASCDTTHGDGDGNGNPALSLADMQKLLAGMEERIINTLTAQILADHATIDRHDQTIQAIETSMNDFQGRITALEAAVGSFLKEKELMKFKVDDLENRSRRRNIRITGIPERAEGTRPTSFIESFIEELFGTDAFPRSLAVDRAHRVAVQRRPDGAPWPFIACVHHFQTKQRIMQLAREKGPLSHRGSEIHIYGDYSAEVAQMRATFSPVKSALRKAGYQFSLIFPTKLRVIADGTRHEFNTPSEAAASLENIQNIQPAV